MHVLARARTALADDDDDCDCDEPDEDERRPEDKTRVARVSKVRIEYAPARTEPRVNVDQLTGCQNDNVTTQNPVAASLRGPTTIGREPPGIALGGYDLG